MRHTSRLKTFTWYTSVALLVSFAVLVSVVRLTIGSVSEFRERLEETAGHYLGQPVTIRSMDTRLVGLRPSVVLGDVSLLEKKTRERLAHFNQISLSIDPFSSLSQLQPVVDLAISGANIVVGLREDGSFSVQGVSLSKQAHDEGSGGALGAWFLSQARLAIQDSRLVWRDFDSGKELVFSGVNLELQNLQERHRLSGYVKLPSTVGKTLQLSLDIRGNLLNRKDWLGELYVKAENLHPAPWLKSFSYKGLRLEKGRVDMEMWSSWQGGLLQTVEGQFDLGDLIVSDGRDKRKLQQLAGQVRYTVNDEGWLLQLQRLLVQPDETPVKPLALELQHGDEKTVFQATELPLDLVKRYGPYLPQLSKAQREWLIHASPQGWLRDVHLELAPSGKVHAAADIDRLELESWQRLPGVKGLTGHVGVDWPHAVLVVDSKQMSIALPRLFRRPLEAEQLTGAVRMQKEGTQWRVAGTTLRLTTPDIHANVAFDSWISSDEAPLISLTAQVADGRVSAVPHYLPVHIMSEGSVNWLDNAFVAGRITDGRVLLHGRLNKFPFRNNQGRFEVNLDTDNVTLHYRDNWPELAAVAGQVLFEGAGMVIDVNQAKVFGARLNKTRVAIADFRKPVLAVRGEAAAPVNDALDFLRASPLAAQAEKPLAQMNGTGSTHINLDLAIPLSSEMANTRPLAVKGQVQFQGDTLHVTDGVDLSDVRGELDFSEHKFESQEIKANLFGEPTIIMVFAEQDTPDEATTVIAAQGQTTAEALQQAFHWPVLAHLSGKTDWQARLRLPRGANGGSALVIHSTMTGMAVDLPSPAAKDANLVRPLTVTWPLGGGDTLTHRLKYGDVVNAVWQQESAPFRLRRAGVEFGSEAAVLPEQPTIHIGGTLEQLAPRAWVDLYKDLTAEREGGAEKVLPIEVAMNRLQILPEGDAKAEKVPAGETEGSEPGLKTTDVPPMTVAVESFSYGDMALGRLSFAVEPRGERVLINTLKLESKNFTLTGNGQWLEGANTSLDLKLRAGNFGHMLRGLGFASIVSGGKTDVVGSVSWPGQPAAFSLGSMSGTLHVNIEDGVIDEVDPGAGKLLGLLSLEALPRRLFLDFSDLSGKGLQFSSVKGDIRFDGGSAYTQNLHLKSSPANILVTGRTGLVSEDFDQLIAVVPNVSGTVSVAGALAWGPQVAAVLLVLQKLFQSDIDAATMTRYELKGSWDKPVLTKLEPLPAPASPDTK